MNKDGKGYLEVSNLKEALDIVGFKVPQWQVRQLIDDMERVSSGTKKTQVTFDELQKVKFILIPNLFYVIKSVLCIAGIGFLISLCIQ